jgi:putative peptidoglycan lipid II flippase
VPAAIAQQNRAIELVLLLTLPAAAGLVAVAAPIINVLFQHGAFTAADTNQTARALAAFALGLPAYVLIKVLTPGFHARGDTTTPVRVALGSMLVNLAANLTLVWPLGHIGIALGTALSAWVNAGVLAWLLVRRGAFALDTTARRRLPRFVIATLAMMAALALAQQAVTFVATPADALPLRAFALALLLGVGGLAYLAAARALGLFTFAELKARLKRKR